MRKSQAARCVEESIGISFNNSSLMQLTLSSKKPRHAEPTCQPTAILSKTLRFSLCHYAHTPADAWFMATFFFIHGCFVMIQNDWSYTSTPPYYIKAYRESPLFNSLIVFVFQASCAWGQDNLCFLRVKAAVE